jgi:hypothetical protein
VRRALLVALLALFAVPAVAGAKLVPQVGRTTLSLGGPASAALKSAGVVVRPAAPTSMPVVAGVADTASGRAILAHAGRLRLRDGGRRRVIRRLILVRGGGPSVILGQVRGHAGGCRHITHSLNRLPHGRKLVHAVRTAIAPLCTHRKVIIVARIAGPALSGENGVDRTGGRLRLRPDAVDIINRVAGAHVVHRNMGWGAVAATSCQTEPCPPPTILGSFLPFMTGSVGAPEIIKEAQALGDSTIRFGSNVGEPRPILSRFASAGLRVVLAVRATSFPSEPPTTPAELAAYRARFETTAVSLPPATIIQVENEENAVKFFGGTMGQYGGELAQAVDVAHAHGLQITNGGLTFKPLVLMAWQDLKARGEDAAADDLVSRVFTNGAADARVLADLRAHPFTGLHNQNLQGAWDRAKQLIPIYRASAMDWVNFHWYGDDDAALATCVRYLERATGKLAVTTEIGQYDVDPAVVTGHLHTLIDVFHLPLVVWYDADSIPAKGLHDAPGVLRPNGLAFRSFVDANRAILR